MAFCEKLANLNVHWSSRFTELVGYLFIHFLFDDPAQLSSLLFGNLVDCLARLIRGSGSVVGDSEPSLQWLFLIGTFLSVGYFASFFQGICGYLFVEDSLTAHFIFPESFSPARTFEPVRTNSGIFLQSRSSIFEPHDDVFRYPRHPSQSLVERETCRSYHISRTESVTDLILDEIRRCVFSMRHRPLWGSVIVGMSTISAPIFRAEFRSITIEFSLSARSSAAPSSTHSLEWRL